MDMENSILRHTIDQFQDFSLLTDCELEEMINASMLFQREDLSYAIAEAHNRDFRVIENPLSETPMFILEKTKSLI